LHPPLSVSRQQDSEHRDADSEEDNRCRFESGKVQLAVLGTLGRKNDGFLTKVISPVMSIAS